MNGSIFSSIKYMNGSIFSMTRYMIGVGFRNLIPPPPSERVLSSLLSEMVDRCRQVGRTGRW